MTLTNSMWRRLLLTATAVAAGLSITSSVSSGAAQADTPPTVAVVGGRDASEAYPWMASIQQPHPATGEVMSFCGGSLISSDVVLTAAHCAERFKVGVTQVRVGSYRWQDGGTLAKVAEIKIYPGFVYGKPGNDLALLILDRTVPQKPVKIASDPGPVGSEARTAGWGAMCEFGSPRWPCYPAGLREADLRLVDDSNCWGFDPSVDLCYRGDRGQMACFGDSGGPSFRKVRGVWMLVGVVSGDGDADAGENLACGGGVGIWTDVTKYRDWIGRESRRADQLVASLPYPAPKLVLPYERVGTR